MELTDFLKRKARLHIASGFEPKNLNPLLMPFQKFCVSIATKKGRFALFEDCGLGKTFQQLEWGRQVVTQTIKPVLTLAPLAVVGQTIEEGKKFGVDVWEFNSSDNYKPHNGIYIANYEQLDNIDTSLFSGVVIDESSILKNFEGAYRNLIIDSFRNTPYKLACTATPSPNDPMELGNHAEFLGVMNRNEMLATYFVHDGGETSKWRIKGHAQDTFWKWVCTWSLMFSKPSDIGFEDDGYVLPPLNFIERQIVTPHRSNSLINEIAVSASNFHQEVRLTKVERLAEVVDIVNNTDESFIVWVEQNDEGDYLRKALNGAIEVKGSDTPEFKRDKLLGFAKDEYRVLVTKPKIASFGLNYQNSHNMVFASPDFSFEKLYQAIRRQLRYGQVHPVNVYIITTDTMQNVIQALYRKQQQHNQMQLQTIKYTKELYATEYCKVA